jgi:hypothetical protein
MVMSSATTQAKGIPKAECSRLLFSSRLLFASESQIIRTVLFDASGTACEIPMSSRFDRRGLLRTAAVVIAGCVQASSVVGQDAGEAAHAHKCTIKSVRTFFTAAYFEAAVWSVGRRTSGQNS